MSSFFQSVKRLLQGKPVFDPNDLHEGGPQAAQPQPPIAPAAPQGPQTFVQKGNDRTFPIAQITRTNIRLNGNSMQVYCRIRNNSREMIALDKIRLLGVTRELDTDLRPGEEREFDVYRGNRLQNQNQRTAEIDYKTHRGDYFRAIHDITFMFQSDKTYTVNEIKLHPPIRDIFG